MNVQLTSSLKAHMMPRIHKSPMLEPACIQRALTKRELDVLKWLAHGKSGGEIAMLLGISICTVRIHIRKLMRKLDARNIPHAVARAYRARILD